MKFGGNFLKNRYFANNFVIILRTANFVSTNLIFAFSRAKSPSVTERAVSQENAFKKRKYSSPFLNKTIGLNNTFTLIESNFRFLRYLTVQHSLWQNDPVVTPLFKIASPIESFRYPGILHYTHLKNDVYNL